MSPIDSCVRCVNAAEAAAMAKRLGWNGICVLLQPEMSANTIKARYDVGVSFGIEVEVSKQSEIQKAVEKYRKKFEILAFRPSDADVARAVLETPEADMLTGLWKLGFNHVMANLAKENDVSVCFELQPLMFSHGRQRTEAFAGMVEVAGHIRKARAPFSIGSGAQMPMDMRDAGELLSFGRLLGFGDKEIERSMSDARVLENRKRLSGKWVMPGVEID